MTKIWIVQGSTGEWSDRSEWNVKAFKDKEKAQELINLLETAYQQFPQDVQGYTRPDKQQKRLHKTMGEIDPGFREDYTGTHYYMSGPLELEE